MQTIETKLARIAAVAKAAGLTTDQQRHLIHGTGGSPRRAKRAIRLGIHEQLIAAYTAALATEGSHAIATNACNKLWAELVPSTPADENDDADEAAEAPAAQPAKAKRAAKPVAEQIAEQAVAKAASASRSTTKARRQAAAKAAPATTAADLKALLPA